MPESSAYTSAVDQLRRYILTYALAPGDMLPPLSSLSERFGVSVASLREAVRGLEAGGILSIRHGVGVFVQAYDYRPILENLSFSALFDPHMLQEFLQVREAVEVGALGLVIDDLTAEDLDTLATSVEEMTLQSTAMAAEYRFHTLLFQRLENALLNGLIRLCWLAPRQLDAYAGGSETAPTAHYAVHTELLTALRNRDRMAAHASLSRYFALLRREMA